MNGPATYLVCSHCKCEFLASDRQAKRSREHASEQRKFYCSGICQRAGMADSKRRPFPYQGTCPQCGKSFGSRYQKKYCSMKCYTSSADFKAMLAANASKGNAARIVKFTGEPPKPKVEATCLNCGAKWMEKPSSKSKYCNQRCYREYMAARFDRWFANPQSIALPQGYDEFLSQEELPCLIEGCGWVGKQLGNHVNFAHGITADEFKRAAGFNTRTGLVTPEVSRMLSERPHIHEASFGAEWRPGKPPVVRGYTSKEGREHRLKARAMMAATVDLPPRTCKNCGGEYSPQYGSWNQQFCTVECRDRWYAANPKKAEGLTCSHCGVGFTGTRAQELRTERGKPVFCGFRCRQAHNGAFPKTKARQNFGITTETATPEQAQR